ncbi:hypothetical protein [Intrasporangium sp. DVR]|uniref:hypothetical protein n=1 Tax=Intrasporangium sp. DVR TaxID=3127867 RepID=UPI00313A5732
MSDVTSAAGAAAATASPTGTEEPTSEVERPPWLERDLLRTAVLVITILALAARASVVKDSFFITDDFMLSSRAMESGFGWAYLTRVHTGHFEPIGFATMWLLAHFAPLNWGVTVAVLLAGQAFLSRQVWLLLTELFGRRALVLVPYAIFCITPLTLPAFTWLAAAIIWLPLMIAIAGALRWHTRYVRSGAPRDAWWAVAWFVVGLASFEKIVIFLPYVIVFTLAVAHGARLTPSVVWALARRTRWVWLGYLVASLGYLALYVPGVQSAGNDSPVTAPDPGPLADFVFLSVARTFVPGTFGGPWDWQPTSYALAIVDSPRAFDWALWIVASAVVVGSLVLRRSAARFWAALLVYLLGSIATVAAGRVAFGGSIVALETRYLADAVVPLVVALGAALMPLVDETRPWTTTARELQTRLPRPAPLAALLTSMAVIAGLSLHAFGGYAAFSTNNPARQFVTNTVESIERLPPTAEVYDTEVPGQIIGPLFASYNTASRYLAPLMPDRRKDLYEQRVFTAPYVLNATGALVPMRINPVATSIPRANSCYGARNGTVRITLSQPVHRWGWAVRIGYLADAPAFATVSLGDDSQEVQLSEGLGEVYVALVAEGSELVFTGLPEDMNFCVGDVQLGFPTPAE